MAATKPVTSWAVVSLVASVLGCLGFAALPAIYEHGMHGDTTGVSAGGALLFFGGLSIALGLLGIVAGVVALRRTRGGECGGRGLAWAGLVLGFLPLVVLLALAAHSLWEDFQHRIRDRHQPIKQREGP
jgi:hypothetical protein